MIPLESWRHERLIARTLDEAAAGADLLHLHSNGLIIEAAAAWAKRRGRPYALTLYGTEIWHIAAPAWLRSTAARSPTRRAPSASRDRRCT
jgi:hypothetical protein